MSALEMKMLIKNFKGKYKINPFTHRLYEVRYLMACGQICPRRWDGFFKDKLRWRGECGRGWGGKAAIATAPFPTKICVTHTETGGKSVHGKNAAIYSPVVGLIDLWAFFAWNKRCSILYVDSKKLKSALFWPSYDLSSEVWFCYFS